VWWERFILWLLVQVPLGILVGSWIKDPIDEAEIPDLGNVERVTNSKSQAATRAIDGTF
jgi:hypothetical protein